MYISIVITYHKLPSNVNINTNVLSDVDWMQERKHKLTSKQHGPRVWNGLHIGLKTGTSGLHF